MEKSKVFFTDMRTETDSGLLPKLDRLIRRAGIESIPLKDKFVAIKIHFGEPGNLSYLRPNFAKAVADRVRYPLLAQVKGGRPVDVDGRVAVAHALVSPGADDGDAIQQGFQCVGHDLLVALRIDATAEQRITRILHDARPHDCIAVLGVEHDADEPVGELQRVFPGPFGRIFPLDVAVLEGEAGLADVGGDAERGRNGLKIGPQLPVVAPCAAHLDSGDAGLVDKGAAAAAQLESGHQ